MTTIHLTEEDAQAFIAFRKNQSQMEAMASAWKEVIDYGSEIKNGTITITLQNCRPVKVTRPMQGFVIGLKVKE